MSGDGSPPLQKPKYVPSGVGLAVVCVYIVGGPPPTTCVIGPLLASVSCTVPPLETWFASPTPIITISSTFSTAAVQTAELPAGPELGDSPIAG